MKKISSIKNISKVKTDKEHGLILWDAYKCFYCNNSATHASINTGIDKEWKFACHEHRDKNKKHD